MGRRGLDVGRHMRPSTTARCKGHALCFEGKLKRRIVTGARRLWELTCAEQLGLGGCEGVAGRRVRAGWMYTRLSSPARRKGHASSFKSKLKQRNVSAACRCWGMMCAEQMGMGGFEGGPDRRVVFLCGWLSRLLIGLGLRPAAACSAVPERFPACLT